MTIRKVLVTGSSGHLGEALCRILAEKEPSILVVGLDIKPSEFTTVVGSITDRELVQRCMHDVDAVLHTASLHKPHVATHSMHQFIETNVTGTLVLLEEAVAAHVSAFVLTSTTSIFGDSLRPKANEPAVWINEQVRCIPKNIYGVTKTTAENLCSLFHRNHQLPCIVLRTSRFFPEDDDDKNKRDSLTNNNLKANEFLYRRGSVDDMATAHLCAMRRAPALGFFGVYICTATSPFLPGADQAELRKDPASCVQKYHPTYQDLYEKLGWKMDEDVDRVYDNTAARRDLGWEPRDSFASVLENAQAQYENGIKDPYPLSDLARLVGCKGYHEETFEDGPYPTSATK